ncbi:ATP synthase subunit O, mitochondrial-like isoform X2 [Cucurbita pepo subsp. pepo]|uniref:ATP synthase subunit O, mitochondrial-like isoform X1 n=1 Tax=Cucurbita pepo subsp. pepo TaxID=3664 RepID=UPI000C9D7127|nr:ATP synthase subunit O, mitochondrial-like isoform X1 [Cucurbita pepo subsp. pepo]XP_023525827.1 ATP synthase subunit O, mitochondrial-like isoform X2 [Cucurbita pepo subsp. pepo]
MALASRLRSTIPVLSKFLRSESSCTPVLLSRTYAATSGKHEQKVKMPLALFGGSGNYASALYIAAVKANSLDKVESELFNLVEAIKKSPTFAQFTMDLSVPAETRVKAIDEISAEAKFSEVVKNFLVVLAENGRLRYIDSIAKRFLELTMAHKGEVKAAVTTVIPIPPQEENELKETLQDIIGQGKKVKLEQKIDPSILGGLIVEFDEKVFDMSIKTRARQLERFLRQPVSLDGL